MTDEKQDQLYLPDGVYFLTPETVVVFLGDVETWDDLDENPTFKEFESQHPQMKVSIPYETRTCFLFSEPPQLFKKFGGIIEGCGFNYGSSNLLTGCKDRMFIAAQND